MARASTFECRSSPPPHPSKPSTPTSFEVLIQVAYNKNKEGYETWGTECVRSVCAYEAGVCVCVFVGSVFSPVKRKDTRDHFGFENDHGLDFASRAFF